MLKGVDLRIEHEYLAENIVLIRLVGEIDVYTSVKVRELVIELVNAGYYWIVVDLARVFSFSSTGMGVLVGALKRCYEHDGTVAVVATTKEITGKFKITGLCRIFSIFDDPDNAVAALATGTRPAAGFHPDLEHFHWVPYASVQKDIRDMLKDGR